MKYEHITEGRFIDRPNRFIAHVEINGQVETVHVKNTGRCRELLIPGTQVFLEKSSNPARKTAYDLICVNKKGRGLINMDSQIPNKAALEWVKAGHLFPEKVQVTPEKTYGNSRFDLYVCSEKRKAFIEVKGVTLESDNIARFPDAPAKISAPTPSQTGENLKEIRLVCQNSTKKKIQRTFGSEIFCKIKGEDNFIVTVEVVVDKAFFGWLTSMGRNVHILKPKKAAVAYRDYLKNIAKDYKGIDK